MLISRSTFAVNDDREVVQQIIDDAGLHDVCTLGVKLPDGEEFLQETLNAITVQIAVWWNLLMEMNSPNPPAKRKIASIIENATEQAEKLRDIGDPTRQGCRLPRTVGIACASYQGNVQDADVC